MAVAVVGLVVVVVGLVVVVVGVVVLVGCVEDVKVVVTSSCVALAEVCTACMVAVAVENASDVSVEDSSNVADSATTALSWITEVAMLST